MALTPRTLRRKKLLHRNAYIDPELVSLYHDEPMLDDSSPPLNSATTPVNRMTLGTPTKLRQQTDTITCKTDSLPNIYVPSLSLAERLNRIQYEQDAINKQTTRSEGDDDDKNSVLDLRKYEMIPNKMKLALSSVTQERLFTRNHFFTEQQPEPLNTESTPSPFSSSSRASSPRISSPPSPSAMTTMDDDNHAGMTPVAVISPASSPLACISPKTIFGGGGDDNNSRNQTGTKIVGSPLIIAPNSPTSSVASITTSISETMDISLMSWPGSPVPKPLNSPLSFGRVASPCHRQDSDNIITKAHPLASELVNPFLIPPAPEPIPVSNRMKQRFPYPNTMPPTPKPPPKWHVTDVTSSPRNPPPSTRQKWIISNQTQSIIPTRHKVTKSTRQKILRSRQKPWKITSTATADSHSNHCRRARPHSRLFHHVSDWLVASVPSP